MSTLARIRLQFRISGAQGIARRYFVTNGFDGALTMLGLAMGFHVTGGVSPATALNACLGAAIALGMSGLTSAYVSEVEERKRELQELEDAMATDLGGTTHGASARNIPVIIALVNGLSPLLVSLVIMVPLMVARAGVPLPVQPTVLCIGLAFVITFLLGVFLGSVSESFWLWSGLRALGVALVTSILILSLERVL